MKIQINIIPAENFESKSYKNALAYSEGDDRMLVGEVADMIDSIKKELGNVKLVDCQDNDKSVYGLEPIGWVNCIWAGGATYAIYQAADSKPVAQEVKEVVVEVVNPQYANMSAAEIKTAEKNYDNLHNEGGEGYNPYRDNLTVFAKPQKNKLVEKDTLTGQYDINYDRMIVDSVKSGRLLLIEGFGGIDTLDGGTYRWKHGIAIQLKPGDTLESLDDTEWNDYYSTYQVVAQGQDDSRPVLQWDGFAIEKLARSVQK